MSILFKRCRQQLKTIAMQAACLFLVTVAVWGGALVPAATADAVGVGSQKAAAIMRDRAANEFDRMGASDAGDRVENMLEDVARNSKEIDGDDLENAAQKAKNKAQRDIKRTKKGASKLGDKLENAAEDAADSVKDALD